MLRIKDPRTLRRTAASLCLVAGPLLIDPDRRTGARWTERETPVAYLQVMGENPARAQISAVLLYFGYLLVAVGIFFGIIHLVRYRAVALAHVAGVLAVWGWSALPGRLVFDFYDLSLAQASNREEAIAISERASGYPGSVIMDVPELLENAVHSLEHGAVWITYYPDLPQGEIVRLTDLNQSNSYVLVSPYPDQDAPVVATA